MAMQQQLVRAAQTRPRAGRPPRERSSHRFEPGCGHGALSAELAARCHRLLCSDFSPRAVELMRHRLMGIPGARVEQLEMPENWLHERFDLIVVSEPAYFLAPLEFASPVEHTLSSLTDDGYPLLASKVKRNALPRSNP